MEIEESKLRGPQKVSEFRIEGHVRLEAAECKPSELDLKAHVFDRLGGLLGTGNVNADGAFSVALVLAEPTGIELVVSPPGDSKSMRRSAAYKKIFKSEDWIAEGKRFILKPELILPYDLWKFFWPRWICISGHVRKAQPNLRPCPVPYLKVEVFDVDRERCWWPFIIKNFDLLKDRKVVRLPELLKELPSPEPLQKVTIGDFRSSGRFEQVALNPQPLPPREVLNREIACDVVSARAFDLETKEAAFTRVGEMTSLDPGVSSRLEDLTITSKLPPWMIFPRCFYSKDEVCETHTDCDGYFSCCFRWYPLHFRRGRLRFDSRPDIIIKVTQIIDGVETILYMDPYTSTRWNVTNAHIDLYLDNEDIECGHCYPQDMPPGTQVFFTRIGDDEVYNINQNDGLYSGPYIEPNGLAANGSNVAYGSSLLIYAQFGNALGSGASKRYYRLSYSRDGAFFTPIKVPLGDIQVNKTTLFSNSYPLGPKVVNGVPALYEVRDFANYYWYNPDLIGTWYSWLAEEDTGKYILRLEVFDQNGVKLTSAQVDYRDGTRAPPAVLPPMVDQNHNRVDQCDLIMTLDNKPPVVNLTTPAVNECGVIPWSTVPPLNFDVSAVQENGRLHSWGLYYTKGSDPTLKYLNPTPPSDPWSNTSKNGVPGSINGSVPGASMLNGLTGTCAFALKLWAWAHVRNGRWFIFYVEQMKAIVIEKCK